MQPSLARKNSPQHIDSHANHGKREQREQEPAHAADADVQRAAFAFSRSSNATFELPLQKPGKPQACNQHGNLPQHARFLHVRDQIPQQALEFAIGWHLG
jgi:hypothetical protein